MSRLRKLIRTVQNHFPYLAETKNDAYHLLRTRLGSVHDREFGQLAHLPRRQDDLFLDVGANRGQSILTMRHFRPDAPIVSFEPNPCIFARLRRRFGAMPGVTLHGYGLGPVAGSFPLFIPSYGRFTYDGCASFSEDAARGYFSDRTLYFFDPAQVSVRQVACEVRTLDSLGLSPTVIKIDVEGFEMQVLLGGLETLRRARPALLLERGAGDAEVDGLLGRLGYREMMWRDGSFVAARHTGLNRLLLAT